MPDSRFSKDGEPGPRWAVRSLLVWLVTACLLPGVVGATILLTHEYRNGRTQMEKNTIQTTRALVQAVDNHLLKVQAVAQALSMSGALARRDFALFHREARELVTLVGLGTNVVLRDKAGRQLLNTIVEYGELPTAQATPEQVRDVFATGRQTVADLFIGPVLKRPIMSVDVPVLVNGRVQYALGVGILPEHFQVILAAQGLPSNWLAGVFDSSGTTVARTHAPDRFVGQKASPAFLREMLARPEGMVEASTLEGIPSVIFFSKSPLTNWRVAIGIPRSVMDAPLTQTLTKLAAGLVCIFAIGMILAWLIGRRIVRSFSGLVAPAMALGRGEVVAMQRMEVKEAAAVASAMINAARLLNERTTALQAREAELITRSAALNESESRLKILIDHAPVGLALFDRQMHYLAASRRWREDYRLGDREIIGMSHYDLFPEIPSPWREAHERGLAGEELQAEADRFVRLNGTVQWVRWGIWPWRDPHGSVAGIVIATEEITERIVALEALKRSRQLLQLITDGVPALIAYVDISYRYRLSNRGCQEWLGLSAEDIIGKTPRELLGEIVWEILRPWMERAMTGEVVSFEAQLPHCDGSARWTNISYVPDREEGGQVRGISMLINDITVTKQAEEQIRQLNADLEIHVCKRTAELMAANRELEAFTFATSHDLRGPLGRINSFSSLLERTCRDRLDGDGLFFLNIIRQNASRLTLLVDDLLNHARIAQQTVELQSIDISDAVQNAVRDKMPEGVETKAEIRLNVPRAKVVADAHALSQALGNLMENAIKYSSSVASPLIEVGGEVVADRFCLWVRDNGIGFKMQYHDKIFQMFQRLHTYTEYAGSGVGLALVKRAVERMGGKVWAESELGQGATFYLELQAAI